MRCRAREIRSLVGVNVPAGDRDQHSLFRYLGAVSSAAHPNLWRWRRRWLLLALPSAPSRLPGQPQAALGSGPDRCRKGLSPCCDAPTVVSPAKAYAAPHSITLRPNKPSLTAPFFSDVHRLAGGFARPHLEPTNDTAPRIPSC